MCNIKLFVLVLVIEIVKAELLSLTTHVSKHGNVSFSFSGSDRSVISDDDIRFFGIEYPKMNRAAGWYFGKRPDDLYYRSPTPWGDLYKSYNWKQVERVVRIDTAELKSLTKERVVVLTQDFENNTNQPIKVNPDLTHKVTNTLTRSARRVAEQTTSRTVRLETNLILATLTGTHHESFTNTWGDGRVKTKTEIIGTDTDMETTLQPGQAVTVVLSVNAGYVEILVNYRAKLKGYLALNYSKRYKGRHFWHKKIKYVMKAGGFDRYKNFTEIIKYGFHVGASLKVYNKATGMLNEYKIGETGYKSNTLYFNTNF